MARDEHVDQPTERRLAGGRGPSAALRGSILAATAAALPMIWLWGYSVDDALIAARVASNLAHGFGYCFNPGGPVVDAVTPLGWVFALVPFAKDGPMAALNAARWVGALAWLGAAWWLGGHIGRLGRRSARYLPLAVLAFSAPLGGWAVAGMETGVVTALATIALARSRWSLVGAGLASAWRPELIPWAVTLAAGGELARGGRLPWAGLMGVAAAVPATAVALVRLAVFGQAAPLAVLAKPSDTSHGLFYVAAALLWTGVPLLLLAPRAIWRSDSHYRAIVAAAGAHCLSLIAAGGDWMAFFRLVVPVLPGLLLVGAVVAERASWLATSARLVPAVAVSMLLLIDQGAAARQVMANRARLIADSSTVLRDARRVAAVDIGWVGAATLGRVVDLAGVTDPTVARLAGGHTSKRIPIDLLRRSEVDRVVLLLPPGVKLQHPWWTSPFSYAVERRIVEQSRELQFEPLGAFPLGRTGRTYLILGPKDDGLSNRKH